MSGHVFTKGSKSKERQSNRSLAEHCDFGTELSLEFLIKVCCRNYS